MNKVRIRNNSIMGQYYEKIYMQGYLFLLFRKIVSDRLIMKNRNIGAFTGYHISRYSKNSSCSYFIVLPYPEDPQTFPISAINKINIAMELHNDRYI